MTVHPRATDAITPLERARRLVRLIRDGADRDEESLVAAAAAELLEAVQGADRRQTDPRERQEVARRAELAIRSDARLVERILEAVPGGVVVVSATGAVVKANVEGLRFLGLSYDELTRRYVADFQGRTFHADGSLCPWEDYPVSRCLASGQAAGPSLIGVEQPSGEVRWALFRAVPWHDPADGERQGAVVTFVDVTEQRRGEEALRRSEERFRTVIENAPDNIGIIDPAGRIQFINRVTAAWAGVPVLGRECVEFVVPEQQAGYRAALERVFAAGESVEVELQTLDGAWFATRILPLARSDDAVLTALWIATDVTGRRAEASRQRELERRLQEAQRLESLEVLAGGIAHDFNNLLVGVLGNVELAQCRLGPLDPARAFLGDAITAAGRAAELVEHLLAYAGRAALRPDVVDLNQLVEEMAQLLRTTISRKAELRLELAPGLPTLLADGTQLRQVVMNLLTNASEALEDGRGTIAIRTALVAPGGDAAAGPGVGANEPQLLLEVRDSGCGMDELTRVRIFDPFFTTKFTGRGLGLAAVLGILRGHRGTIDVDSRPGQGTTVRVMLPARSGAGGAGEAPSAVGPVGPAAAGTVLVVDDEEHVRTVARQLLEDQGYRVLTAPNGRVGLELVERHGAAVALVLLDLLMPEMDGEEMLAGLRRVAPTIPVVVCSGHGEMAATAAVQRHGPVTFLGKPFRLDELLATVRREARQVARQAPTG